MNKLISYIRTIPDFPKPGICFYDICPLLQNPQGFNLALTQLENYIKTRKPDKIAGIEARGFIFGAALADRLKIGFVPIRKAGKLPYQKVSVNYELEYGANSLEIHVDGIAKNERVMVVDDLIATGGTIKAGCELIEKIGGEIVGIAAVIALVNLPFQPKLAKYDLHYLLSCEG